MSGFTEVRELGSGAQGRVVFPTTGGLEMVWSVGGSECGHYVRLTAPYARVRDLLKPELLTLGGVSMNEPRPQVAMNEERPPAGFTELKELGRGAQGRVVLARHDDSGDIVAIKYLAAERLTDERALEQFRGEARTLVQVANPHIARLRGLVETPDGAALVMEAVNGVALRKLLDRYKGMSPESALVVLKGSLLGLAAAHAAGVVHRDYKPANVMVQADGLSKLIDFGIAGLAGSKSGSGTPAYMAPEQCEGGAATPATDVYAATCVFFECVTGHRPYAAGGRMALMRRHLRDPVPVQAVPEPLRPLVARGMAKDPAERPPGAAAFVDELESVAGTAYGPDWEARGWAALGIATAAVAMLLPLAALGVSAAGGGVAAGAGAAGHAPGQVAVAKATVGKGLLVTTGAKVTAAVATTAVVATAGAGTYVVANENKPKRPAQRVNVATSIYDQAYPLPGGPLSFQVDRAQYVTVSGIEGKAAAVNRLLRRPLDREIAIVRAFLKTRDNSRPRRDLEGAQKDVLLAKAEVGLRGPRLVSVRYQISWVTIGDVEGGTSVFTPVTVDLKTGRELAPADFFKPRSLTEDGLRSFLRRVSFPRARFGGGPGGPCTNEPADGRRADFEPDGNGRVKYGLMFAARQLEVTASHVSYLCEDQIARVPYTKVRDMLSPGFAALLP